MTFSADGPNSLPTLTNVFHFIFKILTIIYSHPYHLSLFAYAWGVRAPGATG